MKNFVVVTHCPLTTPHYDRVANVLFIGSYVECEAYQGAGFITRISNAPRKG